MNSIIECSQKDWNKFLKENNITKQQVDYYLNNILDTPAFDEEAGKVINIKTDTYIKGKSNIHGIGIFAKKLIVKNDIIGIVIGSNNNKKYRSYLGRFTNHSNFKNVIFKEINNGDVIAVCIKDIQLGEEILVDYRDHFLKW